MKDLISIVNYLVDKSILMKNEFTDATDVPIEFACIFCQSDEEYKKLTAEIQKLGKVVQDTPTGFTYLLNQPLETEAGSLKLVKIRKPDPLRKERGDTDFNTNYPEFKKKYSNEQNFELIKRTNFEMLRLSVPNQDVMVCFSSVSLGRVLGSNSNR
ncbi:MAG: hypothetical protein A3A57_00750 [Candidatus Woykebacteria bacterium RIFCSPLOWO2_01_FULL_41_12]|uniref:Uncharacterized protein n=1 Tax=Candidatus Woykebacteria bacterium RIFCSPLOWO2_01_FULL_41_12 TaxID=1802604 RepID=A0A1G1WUT9_9BACT|nr:MAG: hypothetical protein A3A57_00750 [Candidatus Woykebacteria bacterium RIFCSPLOWO2_01_FULL_41_12]